MTGVLTGFATLTVVIGIGWLLAHLKVLGSSGPEMLTKVVFLVGSPALMITVMGQADVTRLFSTTLIASLAGVVITAVIYIVLAIAVWKRPGTETVIGTFSSSYVNAGNLGIPIATYALGDGAAVAPMLLVQLIVLQPAGLLVLDLLRGGRELQRTRGEQLKRLVISPLTNPLLIGSVVGVVLSVTGTRLPQIIEAPITLLAGMAIPAMLIAYGVSLRLGPLPGRGSPPVQLAVITALKLIVQPLAAGLVAYHLLGLHGPELLAVTIVAALPTAQNVFLFAVRYNSGIPLARDAVFVNTVGSVPVIIAIVAIVSRL